MPFRKDSLSIMEFHSPRAATDDLEKVLSLNLSRVPMAHMVLCLPQIGHNSQIGEILGADAAEGK